MIAQIDGLSGTGKTTLSAELVRRGHHGVDADAEFAYFGDPLTGRPTEVKIRAHWIWDLERLRGFCARQVDHPLFICGGALNQHLAADLFTHRFTLWVDDETMRHRLLSRAGDGYGKDPAELVEQLELNRTYASQAQSAGGVVIDATQPIADVAAMIIRATVGQR